MVFVKLMISVCALVLAATAGISEAQTQTYTIGEEDVLQISVWGNPDLNSQVPVRPGGIVSLPLLGEMKVAGLTTDELKAKLENDYSQFVKAPTVSVVLTAINSFKVFVFGGGVSPATQGASGAITLRRHTTLLQLLAQLGSLKDADLEESYLMREGKKLPVNFTKLVTKGDVSHDVPLKPNDIIFIPDNFEKRIRVVGAVKTPGIFPYSQGMTALDAVLSAGGFTEYASQNSVVITRKEGQETLNIDVKLKDVIKDGDLSKNVPLKPGDLVNVKTGIW